MRFAACHGISVSERRSKKCMLRVQEGWCAQEEEAALQSQEDDSSAGSEALQEDNVADISNAETRLKPQKVIICAQNERELEEALRVLLQLCMPVTSAQCRALHLLQFAPAVAHAILRCILLHRRVQHGLTKLGFPHVQWGIWAQPQAVEAYKYSQDEDEEELSELESLSSPADSMAYISDAESSTDPYQVDIYLTG